MNDATVGKGDWAIFRHEHLSKPSKSYHGLIVLQRRRPGRRLQQAKGRLQHGELARRVVRTVERGAVGGGHPERPRRAPGFSPPPQKGGGEGGGFLARARGA